MKHTPGPWKVAFASSDPNKPNFAANQRVAYIPTHAHGDIGHKDVEFGHVSSINEKYVFVRFDKTIARAGWDGATAQPCRPEDLRKMQREE